MYLAGHANTVCLLEDITGDSTVAEKPLQDSCRRLAPLPKPSPLPSAPSPCQAAPPHPSAPTGALPLRCQLGIIATAFITGKLWQGSHPLAWNFASI